MGDELLGEAVSGTGEVVLCIEIVSDGDASVLEEHPAVFDALFGEGHGELLDFDAPCVGLQIHPGIAQRTDDFIVRGIYLALLPMVGDLGASERDEFFGAVEGEIEVESEGVLSVAKTRCGETIPALAPGGRTASEIDLGTHVVFGDANRPFGVGELVLLIGEVKALTEGEHDRFVEREPWRREGLFEEFFQVNGIHRNFRVQRDGERHLEAVLGGSQVRLARHQAGFRSQDALARLSNVDLRDLSAELAHRLGASCGVLEAGEALLGDS